MSRFLLLLTLLFPMLPARAQVDRFPFAEPFDTLSPPALPSGWGSSAFRSSAGDFTSTRSAANSESIAVLSTNPSIGQYLISPLLFFPPSVPESLVFFERRSSTHNAGLVIEWSADRGDAFQPVSSDTFRNGGTTDYRRRAVGLAAIRPGGDGVLLRWRLLGDGTGTTGTIRFDDVRVTARPAVDVVAASLTARPSRPSAGDSLRLILTILNRGVQPVASCSAAFYRDLNMNGVAEEEECLGRAEIQESIAPGESLSIEHRTGPLAGGHSLFIAVCSAEGDSLSGDDTASLAMDAGWMRGSIVVNEIMYDPSPGMAEYVELYNPLSSTVDLEGWTISDRPDTSRGLKGVNLSKSSLPVCPGGYLLAASDSSVYLQFPELRYQKNPVLVRSGISLRNAGDYLILRDATGEVIDSLRYDPAWQNPAVNDPGGKSLERINPLGRSFDPRNWTTCADPSGGTPDRRNSVYTIAVPASSALSVTPNPFSPDGDGFEDIACVSYVLPFTSAVIRIRIFDALGHLVRTLADGELSGASGTVFWDGLNDRRARVNIGIYIILLEAYSGQGGRSDRSKAVVVVATRLH